MSNGSWGSAHFAPCHFTSWKQLPNTLLFKFATLLFLFLLGGLGGLLVVDTAMHFTLSQMLTVWAERFLACKTWNTNCYNHSVLRAVLSAVLILWKKKEFQGRPIAVSQLESSNIQSALDFPLASLPKTSAVGHTWYRDCAESSRKVLYRCL